MTVQSLRKRLFERFILQRLGEWWASLFLLLVTLPLMADGMITFSDLAFGMVSDNYLNLVMGVFNEQLGTPNWFNLPRLLWITPSFILSWMFDSDGQLFVVSLIYAIFFVSAFSFGSLMRRLSDHRDIPIGNFGICIGCIFYAFNPWVLVRIQHIFLLCGYALVPLALSWTWRALGRESWNGDPPFTLRPTLSEMRYQLTLGMITSASFGGIHFGVFIIIVVAMLGVLFSVLALPTAFRLRLKLRWFGWFFTRALISTSTFLLFSAYWSFPFVFSIIKGVRPSQNNVNVIETIATFSRASTIENISLGLSYWWPMFEHRNVPSIFWYAGWLILFVAVLGVIHSRRWVVGIAILVLIVTSSGTYMHAIAPVYISMVFDAPYPFGDMIRDPNKLYGVAALPIALCVGWGCEFLKKYQWRNIPILQWETFLFICLWLYPIYDIYMLGFYQPVVWPDEYQEMQDELNQISNERDGDIKVLYLPVADFALDKRLGYTSPDFNEITIHGKPHRKSTGDHVAFDTRHDTIFPFEGNDINVLYFLLYLHHLLDDEDLEHVGALASKGGITHIVMREDYSAWIDRFAHYREVLDSQKDLKKVWSNSMMAIYEVQNVQADAESLHHLIYSAGGLERLTWYPRMFNESSKQFNILFPYSSHYQKLDILREGDAVETTDLPDLALIQLPKDRFIFAADKIITASPQLRWSKIVVSAHEWQYVSNFYKIRSDQFNFDMGSGVAFTTTPIAVEPEAYIIPEVGEDLFVEPFKVGASWFSPYEDMDIAAVDVDPPKPQSLRVIVPDDGIDAPPEEEEEHKWRVLETTSFPIQEQSLYELKGKLPRIHNADLELRVAMYSKEGHFLGASTAEVRTNIPEPLLAERKKSFLTPKDTAFAKLEVRVRNRRPGLLEFEVHDIYLYDLETYSKSNRLPLELNERSGEQDGKLWIRFICSDKGGTFGVHMRNKATGEKWMDTLNSKCDTTAHFTWKYVNTPAGLDRNIEIENLTGINAINALIWTSHEEYTRLIDRLERDLSDKVLFHIVDSSMFQVDQALPNYEPNTHLVSGTMMHSLNGTLTTTVDIVHDAQYSFSIQDYLPNETDRYRISIWKRRNDQRGALIFEDTIEATSERRTLEGNNLATTSVASLNLSPGQYDIALKLQSDQPVILTEQDFDQNVDPEWITKNPEESSVRCEIPKSIGAWATTSSQIIEVDHDTPLMLWYKIHIEYGREFHAKLLYYDADMNEIKVTYIQGVDSRDPDYSTVQTYIGPPKGAMYMRVQFLAKNIIQKTDGAHFIIQDLRLWEMERSPAIDALLFTREPGLNLEDSPATIEVLEKKLGKRDILVSNPVDKDARTFTRFILYESPIRHWDFYYNRIPIEGFAVNGIGYGVNVPVNNAIIYAEIPLNRMWRYGLIMATFGFVLLGLFSSIKLLRKIRDSIRRRAPGTQLNADSSNEPELSASGS